MDMTESENAVISYIEEHKEDLYVLLSRLIQIDTVNTITSGNESNCIPFISNEYQKLGLRPEIYMPDDVEGLTMLEDYLPGRGTDKRPNISAVLKGFKGDKRVMLAAHTDVMPFGDESLWTAPPLSGLIRDGRVYGRGACDDKYGVAASIMAVKALRHAGIEPASDVVLTAYCDEEYGGGNGTLAACLKYPCDTYVNIDGMNSEVSVRALGGGILGCDIRSNTPSESAARVIDALEKVRAALKPFEKRRRAEMRADPYFAASGMENDAFRIIDYSAGRNGCDLDKGTIEFAYYTTADEKVINTELIEIEKTLKPGFAKDDISFQGFVKKSRFFHCLDANENDPATECFANAAGEILGKPADKAGVYLSDLSLFLKHGSLSSFNFGIARSFNKSGGAHQPDEYADCLDLVNTAKALALFLIRFC